VWRKNGLLTEREFDKLGGIYQRMTSPPDTSIIEARRLSLSQVCLYFGGWVVVLGSAVLFYQTLEQVAVYWRPMPAISDWCCGGERKRDCPSDSSPPPAASCP